jgi:hypothetical protein
MRAIDEQHDGHLCPDCDMEYIKEIAQTKTDKLSDELQPVYDEALESLDALQYMLGTMLARTRIDRNMNANRLLLSFLTTISECTNRIITHEEKLISIDNELTDAFVEDITACDNVYLCATCHEQSCDHFEE